MQNLSSIHRLRKAGRSPRFWTMVGWSENLEKFMIFEESVLTFVDIVQSSRLEKINQRSILGFRFFNVEKYWKNWKVNSRNFVKNWRLLAQNDVQKCKIALLMQNWRPAGWWTWLVETACLLESNILSGPGHVGWQSGWELCVLFRRENRFFD